MSKVVAVTMIRDEEDIIQHTIRNLVWRGIDHVIIANNLSTDNTASILGELAHEFPYKIHVFEDNEVGYFQSRKITEMAKQANLWLQATHILPFDADEYWYAKDGRSLKEIICSARGLLNAEVYEHRATLLDPIEPNPFLRLGYRLEKPLELGKIAFEYQPDYIVMQGNHGIQSGPDGSLIPAAFSALAIRHYPQRSPSQLLRKVQNGGAAYAATDLPFNIGQHWREWYQIYLDHGENAIFDIFLKHYYYSAPWREPELILDPAPPVEK